MSRSILRLVRKENLEYVVVSGSHISLLAVAGLVTVGKQNCGDRVKFMNKIYLLLVIDDSRDIDLEEYAKNRTCTPS